MPCGDDLSLMQYDFEDDKNYVKDMYKFGDIDNNNDDDDDDPNIQKNMLYVEYILVESKGRVICNKIINLFGYHGYKFSEKEILLLTKNYFDISEYVNETQFSVDLKQRLQNLCDAIEFYPFNTIKMSKGRFDIKLGGLYDFMNNSDNDGSLMFKSEKDLKKCIDDHGIKPDINSLYAVCCVQIKKRFIFNEIFNYQV